ncbi:MAG TPA: formaldehyde-activating enzyme, partial [Verrucomicrobiae bacterium]|nr:formaldehyde-activating enzyme [Verrucomicrobiae bacterium]
MSGTDVKKPETREEFVKTLTEAAKKEVGSKNKPTKPTIVGTAKELEIHRDTLYTWLKEFNVDFKEIVDRTPTAVADAPENLGNVYLIGESLVGEGNEVAHIDLMIGDKDGPVGQAFANGMTNLSAGHT